MTSSPAARAVGGYLSKRLKSATNCALSNLFLFAALLWSAMVAARLWLWFAVPLGAPQIKMTQMVGLILLLAALHPRYYRYKVAVNWRETIVGAILTPAVLFGIGYIIHKNGG